MHASNVKHIHQALECRNISEKVPQPRNPEVIKSAVGYGDRKRDHRPQTSSAARHTAIESHNYKCRHGTDHLPANRKKVSGGISMICVRPYDVSRWESKYESVKIVSQDEQQQSP